MHLCVDTFAGCNSKLDLTLVRLFLFCFSFYSLALGQAVLLPLHRLPAKPTNKIAVSADGSNTGPDFFSMKWNIGHCCSNGKFYINIAIGSPPQPFRVSIDTGSSYLALPSSHCKTCSSSPNRYSMESSAFGKPNPCHPGCQRCIDDTCALSLLYTDGSGFNATFVSDVFMATDDDAAATAASMGGVVSASSTPIVFTQITSEAHRDGGIPFEPSNVDGIWGLAYSSLHKQGPTVFDQLLTDGYLQQDVFAICMSSEQGMLDLGGNGTSMAAETFQFTPIIKKTYYTIEMLGLTVNGQKVSVSSKVFNKNDAIVDSGSTDVILPHQAYQAIKTMLRRNCTTGAGGAGQNLVGICDDSLYNKNSSKTLFEGYCYAMTEEQVNQFPTLSFILPAVSPDGSSPYMKRSKGGAQAVIHLDLLPRVYLQGNRCGNMTNSNNSSADGLVNYALALEQTVNGSTILGDVFMRQYVVAHHRAEGKIGFARPRAHCNPATQ